MKEMRKHAGAAAHRDCLEALDLTRRLGGY